MCETVMEYIEFIYLCLLYIYKYTIHNKGKTNQIYWGVGEKITSAYKHSDYILLSIYIYIDIAKHINKVQR